MFKATRAMAMRPSAMMMMRQTPRMTMRQSPQLFVRQTLQMRSPVPVCLPYPPTRLQSMC